MKLVQGSHQPCTQLSCGERGLLSITPFLPEPPTPLRDALHVRLLHLLLWFLESTFCASSVQFIPEGFTLFDAVVSEMSSFRAGLLISGVWKCSLFCLWTCVLQPVCACRSIPTALLSGGPDCSLRRLTSAAGRFLPLPSQPGCLSVLLWPPCPAAASPPLVLVGCPALPRPLVLGGGPPLPRWLSVFILGGVGVRPVLLLRPVRCVGSPFVEMTYCVDSFSYFEPA